MRTLKGLFALALALVSMVVVSAQTSPKYQVDPSWPKQLPNDWVLGQVGGMAVDSQDHIWVFQRPRSNTVDELSAAQNPPLAECCTAAPSVLEFDTAGTLLRSWGGPGHAPNWPTTEHGIYVDRTGNVWLTGNSVKTDDGPEDRVILKFTADGKLLATFGRTFDGPDNNQEIGFFGRVAALDADEPAGELYVADGYGNRRVVVLDMATGAFKRGWGAYGIPLAEIANGPLPAYAVGQPPAKQFLGPVHCIKLSRDGLVYVCDRTSNRVQVFRKDGTFVKELFVRPRTLGNGSAWTVNFSADAAQRFLLVGDGRNNVIWLLNRETGEVAGTIGHNGRNAGQFHWVHQLVVDWRGNLYTGEVDTGKRLQKFILQR